jgi:CheY-like chemotaxis protein
MSPSEPSAPSTQPGGAEGFAALLAALADGAAPPDALPARICELTRQALGAAATALYLGRPDRAAVHRAAAGLDVDPPAGVPGRLDAPGCARLTAWARTAGYARVDLLPLLTPGDGESAQLGSLALFHAPAAPAPPAADLERLAAAVAVALVGAGAAARRVLLVEDDADNREAMSSLLSMADFEVTAVGSGDDACAAFAPNRFDVVLTDLSLPDIDGWEVARASKTAAPTTPVALITGWGVTLLKAEIERRGVDLVIKKPLDPRVLLNEIENLLQVGGRNPSA